jgi:hypothetical protein
MHEELAQRNFAHDVFRGWTAETVNLGTAGLDDPSIRNSGRTHRLACAAAEAEVDVTHLLLFERHRSSFPLSHQINPAAR